MKIQTDQEYAEYIKSKTLPELVELANSINRDTLRSKFTLIKKRIAYLKRRQRIRPTFQFRTRISSPEGKFLKFFIGPLMIGITALTSLSFLLSSQPMVFTILPAAVCLLVIWLFRMEFLQYREVYLDSAHLYVKSGRREISIPISNIERVHETVATNIRPITLYFQYPTEIGDKITFLPLRDTFLSSAYDSTVVTLLERIKKNKKRSK